MERRDWVPGLIMIAVVLAATGFLYGALPDPMPSHWNAAGEVDDYLPKPWGALAMPLAMLLTWVLLLVLPAISPRGFRMNRFRTAYAVIMNTVIGFEAVVAGVVLAASLGHSVALDRVVPAGVGVLLVVIGNYLGKTTRNFFLGVRTPWTLASEEVWNRTHRLAGWLFAFAGLVMIAFALSGVTRIEPVIVVIVIAALVPVVYSYVLYRRIEGFADDGDVQ